MKSIRKFRRSTAQAPGENIVVRGQSGSENKKIRKSSVLFVKWPSPCSVSQLLSGSKFILLHIIAILGRPTADYLQQHRVPQRMCLVFKDGFVPTARIIIFITVVNAITPFSHICY